MNDKRPSERHADTSDAAPGVDRWLERGVKIVTLAALVVGGLIGFWEYRDYKARVAEHELTPHATIRARASAVLIRAGTTNAPPLWQVRIDTEFSDTSKVPRYRIRGHCVRLAIGDMVHPITTEEYIEEISGKAFVVMGDFSEHVFASYEDDEALELVRKHCGTERATRRELGYLAGESDFSRATVFAIQTRAPLLHFQVTAITSEKLFFGDMLRLPADPSDAGVGDAAATD